MYIFRKSVFSRVRLLNEECILSILLLASKRQGVAGGRYVWSLRFQLIPVAAPAEKDLLP